MKKKSEKLDSKKIALGVVVLALLAGGIYQNCAGYHERSADFSISQAQVDAYVADVQCAVANTSSVDTSVSTAVSDISNFETQEGSEFFYSEAPSPMGDIDLVAPLNFGSLRSDGGSTPQKLYAFFVVLPEGGGTLVLALSDTSSANGTPVPTAAPTAFQGINQVRIKTPRNILAKNHQLDASSSNSSCTTTNPLNLTTIVGAYNDGTQNLESASFDNDIFEMELNLGGNTLRVRSYDVQDGDLQSTIQLEVNQVDSTTGQENYLGDINLTQPD